MEHESNSIPFTRPKDINRYDSGMLLVRLQFMQSFHPLFVHMHVHIARSLERVSGTNLQQFVSRLWPLLQEDSGLGRISHGGSMPCWLTKLRTNAASMLFLSVPPSGSWRARGIDSSPAVNCCLSSEPVGCLEPVQQVLVEKGAGH